MVHQTKYILNSNYDNSSFKGLSSPNNHSFINSLPYINDYEALRNPLPDFTMSLMDSEACNVPLDTGSLHEILKNIKIGNPNRLIFGQPNINSLPNSFAKGSHHGKY